MAARPARTSPAIRTVRTESGLGDCLVGTFSEKGLLRWLYNR
jgi:hypothetical protein